MAIELSRFKILPCFWKGGLCILYWYGTDEKMARMNKMKDDEVAQIGKALGDPNRLAIYSDLAKHDELFCGEMHAKHPISAATLSHHLKVLTDLGLITYRKEGLNMFYRVVPEKFAAYLRYLVEIGPSAESASKTKRKHATQRDDSSQDVPRART